MTKTIQNLFGEYERGTLPNPHYSAEATGPEDYTGTWITGLYSGPRTGRKFVRTYSIWDNGRGSCIGTNYSELDESEYLDKCDRVGCEPEHVEATLA